MNRLTNSLVSCDAPPSDEEAQIADYLDYLCAPLLGIVPYVQRRRLRAEAADHLQGLIEDFKAEGFAPDEAVGIALQEYGNPWQIGQDFVDAWLSGSAVPHLARFAGAATLRAFGWFGIFSVVTLLLIEQQYVLGPPQQSSLPLLYCLAILSPVAAGVLMGLALHPSAGRGVCRAVSVLGLASAVTGVLVLPHLEVLQFALFQFLFWLPVGCLSSAVAAELRRQRRIQNFRATAQHS